MNHEDGDDKFYKPIEYLERHLTNAKVIGDRAGEGGAYENLGTAYQSLGDCQKAIEYHEKHLKIAKEIGDWAGEGDAYHYIGYAYFFLEQFENAADKFSGALEAFNAVRSCLLYTSPSPRDLSTSRMPSSA